MRFATSASALLNGLLERTRDQSRTRSVPSHILALFKGTLAIGPAHLRLHLNGRESLDVAYCAYFEWNLLFFDSSNHNRSRGRTFRAAMFSVSSFAQPAMQSLAEQIDLMNAPPATARGNSATLEETSRLAVGVTVPL